VAGVVRLIVLALCWGSSFLWIKLALAGLSPVQIAFARMALGAAFLLALCAATRLRLPRPGRIWLHVAVLGAIGQAIPFTLFGIGEQTVSSGLAGVLNATTPLWTVIIALLAGQERRLGGVRLAGIVVGFGGTLLIMAPWQGASGTLVGGLACAAAAACYGVTFVYSARFVVGRGVRPQAIAAMQITSGAGILALATPVFGRQPVDLDPTVLASVAVLGLAGTGYAFILVNRLVEDLGPTSASTVTYLMPVIAVLLGVLVLDEELSLRVIAGMLVVLVGVGLTQRRRTPDDLQRTTPDRVTAPAPAGGD
jgi:drug/metabolite transporter (DMT)-like permease